MRHPQSPLPLASPLGLSVLPLGLLLIWLIFLSPLALPNMGGSGLKLPHNILTWAVMAAVTATLWLTLPANSPISLSVTARWLLLAVLILAIPLLYTSPQWQSAGLARWLGLAGGWVFYVSWMQYRPPHFARHWLFYAILLAAVFQGVIALLQLTLPGTVPAWFDYPMKNGRPYGVFLQVNVLASFIACGLALALMLLLLPDFSLTQPKAERGRRYALGLVLVLFPALLVWLQSRIGWLGGGISGALLLWLGWRQAKKLTGIATVSMLFGITIALTFQINGGVETVEHAASNQARLIMLQDSLKMIVEKPWLGWGYGGFEYGFQHYRLAAGLSTLGLGVVRHPHNEILLWWVEGGIAALAGMAILLCAGFRLFWLSWRKHGVSLALAIALLPLLLHSQTEYPFVLSSAHWAIFLLLLAQLDRQTDRATERTTFSSVTHSMLRAVMPMASAAIGIVASIGLYANLSLTAVERNHFADIQPARRAMAFDPWVNTERWHYDQQTHALLMYNQTRDPRLLENYAQWAQGYLAQRIDKNVYASWLAIAQYQQDIATYRRLHQEAKALFPTDPRFLTDLPE
ncbi:O-antigen ligase family protein [Serratia fonticola]|uniref:O-antigen ligase family protein n=1 Tax=Serratia fonticola TaxID=47917 RepID=UPI00217C6E6F|nr:O-antigen ligase [Serratia fonticola]CAI1538860.1 Lipid A core - O-antigen ligase and related enzymes [Serratia fonticola]